MTPRHRSPIHTRPLVAAMMVAAAVALVCPGAAVAAPMVVDAPASSPLSLLHGETTPPVSAIRVGQPAAADDPRRRTERRHRRRQDRRRLRLQTRQPCTGASAALSSPCAAVADPRRHSPIQRRGPPDRAASDSLHFSLFALSPSSSSEHDRRAVGGVWSGPRAVTPTTMTRTTFRDGAVPARRTTRDTGRCTGPDPVACRTRRRAQ